MFERFTDRARRVLVLAQEEARLLDHHYLGSEHLLLGLIAEREGVAAVVLTRLGIQLDPIRAKIREIVDPVPAESGPAPFTPRAKKILEYSLREALQLGHNYIGTEHLLLGLVRQGDGVGVQILTDTGHDLEQVRKEVYQELQKHRVHRPSAVKVVGAEAGPEKSVEDWFTARHDTPEQLVTVDKLREAFVQLAKAVEETTRGPARELALSRLWEACQWALLGTST